MKQFLRVAVVILILAGLGFATYAMFFKPANKDEVYLTLSQVHSEGDEGNVTRYNFAYNSIYNSYKSVEDRKYNLDTKYETVLKGYRGRYFSDVAGDMTVENYTYSTIKENLDTIFNYYYAYSQAVCKMVPQKALKTVKNAVNEYQNAFDSLIVNGFNNVRSLQDHAVISDENLTKELTARYQRLVQLYRQYTIKYIDLIIVAEDFVVEYVFDGEMITDRESLLYSLTLKSLKKAMTGDYPFGEDKVEQANIVNDYIKSALNFSNLAMKSDILKEEVIKVINYYAGNSVLYNEKLYLPNDEGNYDIQVGASVNEYYLNKDKELVSVANSNEKLTEAQYHENNFYLKQSAGVAGGEKLNYKKMIQAYNRVMKDAQDELNKVIELSYSEKVAFVNDESIGETRVRSTFNERYHEDIEYILVCCGFHSIGGQNA